MLTTENLWKRSWKNPTPFPYSTEYYSNLTKPRYLHYIPFKSLIMKYLFLLISLMAFSCADSDDNSSCTATIDDRTGTLFCSQSFDVYTAFFRDKDIATIPCMYDAGQWDIDFRIYPPPSSDSLAMLITDINHPPSTTPIVFFNMLAKLPGQNLRFKGRYGLINITVDDDGRVKISYDNIMMRTDDGLHEFATSGVHYGCN